MLQRTYQCRTIDQFRRRKHDPIREGGVFGQEPTRSDLNIRQSAHHEQQHRFLVCGAVLTELDRSVAGVVVAAVVVLGGAGQAHAHAAAGHDAGGVGEQVVGRQGAAAEARRGLRGALRRAR